MRKKFQDLTIKDAFMFAAVMADSQQCRKLLNMALDMEVLEVHVIAEKSLAYHPEYHGVRLDVLAVEDGTCRRFNVEMQVKSEIGLTKRSRYYLAQMDMDVLLAGEAYNKLPDTYVIFICDFDPFGEHLYRYTIKSICRENGKVFQDGRTTVFLSTKGRNSEEIPDELIHFLRYVEHPEKSENEEKDAFVASLKAQIEAIKRNRDWEAKFMLLEEMMRDERAEGHKEGKQEGQERVNRLIQLLAEQNRMNDIIKASRDKEFQQKLFEEFDL